MSSATATKPAATTDAEATNGGSGGSPPSPRQVLCPPDGINPALEAMEYAVRGPLVLKAGRYAAALKEAAAGGKPANLPFDSVVLCNIGNPQSVGQAPMTYLRQVLATIACPWLLAQPNIRAELPADVVARAEAFLSSTHGLGAYSESKGLPSVRASVAAYITARDGGEPADSDAVFLTNGASDSVKNILEMLVRGPTDGVMVPMPQYPLYSAALTKMGARRVSYGLLEDDGWGVGVDDLEAAYAAAVADGTTVRALVVINPGNPTGQVLSQAVMEGLVRFCERHTLVLMADEVYQVNVYAEGKAFTSFKKVVRSLGSPVELVSFHSTSKGMIGECGLRGGYMEVVNFHPHAMDVLYKAASVSLCSNIPGQVAMDVMVKPPVEGEPSYALYKQEMDSTYDALRRKAAKLASVLNTLPGISCNPSEGSMYLFPRVVLPPAAVAAAADAGMKPDGLYANELLDATGVCVVPGSGFGQAPGTFHIRTTFLPTEDAMEQMVNRMRDFHLGFMKKYGGEATA